MLTFKWMDMCLPWNHFGNSFKIRWVKLKFYRMALTKILGEGRQNITWKLNV